METFEFAGARFELIDAAQLLASAGSTAESILHPVVAPEALPEVTVLMSRSSLGSEQVIRLQGRVTSAARGFDGQVHPAIVGAAYVVPLVDALTRLIGSAREEEPASRQGPIEDPETGLGGNVTYGRPGFDGRVTDTVEASVAAIRVTPGELKAFVRMAFHVARRQAGRPDDDSFLAGRSYRIGRQAPVYSDPLISEPGSADSGPGVRLDSIGGLDDVVRQLRDVADSFQHPEVMARWGARRPQGILIWGPPGTGKTTLATALANEIGGTLKEIRTPDIMAKWVGQSERNIKKIFTQARGYRTPTVLLFDEFDSIIGYNDSPQSAADQVANSVAGIFKQEMNGLIDANPNVIVVATTNFPQRVDESLIRSGRFDVKIAVPLPDAAGRTDILRKMLGTLILRHEREGFRMFADDVDAARLSDLTDGMSGADLKELLRRVQMSKAMQEARSAGPAGAITQDDLRREILYMRQRHR